MTRRTLPFPLLLLLAGCGNGRLEDLGPGPSLPAPNARPVAGKGDEELLPSEEDPADYRYRIRTGDVLTIAVLGEPDMTRTIPVAPDGRISYYVAHEIMAAGKTFGELREEITERLKTHFKAPEVSIIGEAYKGNTATVLGMVGRPGAYVVRADTRLLDVIAMAGGVAQRSSYGPEGRTAELPDLRRAFVLRGDTFLRVNFADLLSDVEESVARNNVRIRAGDRVYIPSATSLENKVIVLGEVARPSVVRFQGSISFLEAIADAGGIKVSAWEKRTFVVRGSLSQPTVTRVNYRDVSTGKAPDVALVRGDIVFVPKTALGKAADVTRQILPLLDTATGVRSLTN